MNLKDIKLKPKLIALLLLVGIIPLALVGYWSVRTASDSLMRKTYDHLTSVRKMKKTQIERFFQERLGDVRVLAKSDFTRQAMEELGQSFMSERERDSFKGYGNEKFDAPENYRRIHDKYFPYFKYYMKEYGYYDVFLITPDLGNIVFSVAKESDFSQQLNNTSSSLRDVWGAAVKRGRSMLSDTKPYAPSNGDPAIFVATPIKKRGKIIGALAFQISQDSINDIMRERAGLGKSGETYLVGEDLLMRSDSFLDKTHHTVMASFRNPEKGKVKTVAVREALQGTKDTKIVIDYNGNSVLSSYEPLQVGTHNWVILAEMDKKEVMRPIYNLIISIIVVGLILSLLIVIVALYFSIMISKPLVRGISLAKRISSGDLTGKIEVNQNDEVGQLATALKSMNSELYSIATELKSNTSQVESGSRELSTFSEQMTSSSKEIKEQTGNVAKAAEEITSNMHLMVAANEETSASATTIVQAMNQLSSNVNSVAAAAEEASTNMTGINTNVERISENIVSVANTMETVSNALCDVNQQTKKAMNISSEASTGAKQSLKSMTQLDESSKKVGQIVKLIDNISSQTNMLALNATIEAASAGDAGKGFAVVATEVKDLAQQTSNANNEIAELIDEIQEFTNEALQHTESVNSIVKEVSGINNNIAFAIDEQSASASNVTRNVESIAQFSKESSMNVQEAASGLKEVTRSVAESSQAVNESTNNLNEISNGIKEIARSSTDVLNSLQLVNNNIKQVDHSMTEMNDAVINTNEQVGTLYGVTTKLNQITSFFSLEEN